jgi:NADPH:quinone reductase-like Zn-dependent oxidoreductase
LTPHCLSEPRRPAVKLSEAADIISYNLMAELEIHTEHGHKADPTGQKVGVLAAVLAVGLAMVTIASHRTHTAAIMHKSTANDDWAHYQSTRV